MSKTTKEWFKEHLTPKEFQQARAAMKEQAKLELWNYPSESLHTAVGGSFTWEDTPEGTAYWSHISLREDITSPF